MKLGLKLVGIAVIGFVALTFAPNCQADGTVTGQVVEFDTTNGISDVRIAVTDATGCGDPKSCKELGSSETDSDGRFSVSVSFYDRPQTINIKYVPQSSYEASGRSHVRFVSEEMGVDTVGLTRKSGDSSSGSDREKSQRAHNAAGAVSSGVDGREMPEDVEWLLAEHGYSRALNLYKQYR